MTYVKEIIEKGEPIPADVIGVEDTSGDEWTLRDNGLWTCTVTEQEGGPAAAKYSDFSAERLITRYLRLTVTAVREPVPERTLIGPPHAHLDAPCTDKCYETASAEPDPVAISNIRVGGAKVPIYADSVPTFHVDEIFPTEPQQADTSALLDLVRQYAAKCVAAERHPSSSAGDMASALFDRIAALVPQQPLVSVPLRERDELRAKLAESEISVAAMRATIDTLYALLGVEGAGVEVAVGAIEALKATAAQPDPSVLSLPQVPDGAIALIGKSTRLRYERQATSPVTWRPAGARGAGEAFTLLEVLQDGGPELIVVMREPRTWPRLNGAPAGLKAVRDCDGEIWTRGSSGRDGTPGWIDEGADKWCVFTELQERYGPLTEVFEDEPGGAR